jgi:hypothetical protein
VIELKHFDPSSNKNTRAPAKYEAAHPKRWVLAEKVPPTGRSHFSRKDRLENILEQQRKQFEKDMPSKQYNRIVDRGCKQHNLQSKLCCYDIYHLLCVVVRNETLSMSGLHFGIIVFDPQL